MTRPADTPSAAQPTGPATSRTAIESGDGATAAAATLAAIVGRCAAKKAMRSAWATTRAYWVLCSARASAGAKQNDANSR